jgi:hypothetical protein
MSTTNPQSLLDTPLVGLEDLQRNAFYVLFEGLNNALSQIEDYWKDRDTEFDTVTGRTTAPTTLEQFSPDNFHEGHKPSLIRGTPDKYPNVAVFAMSASPSAESAQFDHFDSWSTLVLIEIMVKGDDEDLVNRRIQRTTEAAIVCLRKNPTLGGAVTGFESSPEIDISDVFALKANPSNGGYGDRLIWQGSAVQWRVRKDSITPPSGSIFAQSSETDYSQYIDQG